MYLSSAGGSASLTTPWRLARVVGLVWRWAPDVVHTHTAKAGTLGRIAALVYNVAARRSRRCAVIHTFHGHVLEGYFGPLGSAAVRAIERVLARVTDRIVTISVRQRDDITRRFSIAPPGKVVIVPLGLELGPLLALEERTAGLRSGASAAADEIVVGYVGRLVPIKDLETLVRGVALARPRLPRIRLLIAGDGDERPALEARVKELGLDDCVEFLGWRGDLAALYRRMHVFVLTSINEGTPVSLIEAMAAGVPVVATSVGGVPDVVERWRDWSAPPATATGSRGLGDRGHGHAAGSRDRHGRTGPAERARSLRQCPAGSGDGSHVSTDPVRDARRSTRRFARR